MKIKITSGLLAALAGVSKLQIRGVVKATIVSVNDEGFDVQYKIEKFETEPKTVSREYVQEFLKELELGEHEYIAFSSNFDVTNVKPYVNPSKLPSDGRLAGSEESVSYEYVYDKSTGWLKHAHIKGSTEAWSFEVSMDLVDSNFIGGKGSSLVIAVVAAAVVAVAVALAIVLTKMRK